MATGDIVGKVHTSGFTFQPASGVQICITQFLAGDRQSYYQSFQSRGTDMTSGKLWTGTAEDTNFRTDSGIGYAAYVHKYFIDNTHYIYCATGNSYYIGFTGIQTQ